MTAGGLNPPEFAHFSWFVIFTEVNWDGAEVLRTNCSAITHIDNIEVVIESHDNIGATSRLAILQLVRRLEFGKHLLDVVSVCLMATSHYGIFDILGELVLHDDVVVQVFLEVLSTLVASMAIVHGKYLNLRPLVVGDFLRLCLRLNDVQNDCDSVLVGFTHEADVSVSSEGAHRAKLLFRCL